MLFNSNLATLVAAEQALSLLSHVAFFMRANGFDCVEIGVYGSSVELVVKVDSEGESLAAYSIMQQFSNEAWLISRRSYHREDEETVFCVRLINITLFNDTEDPSQAGAHSIES